MITENNHPEVYEQEIWWDGEEIYLVVHVRTILDKSMDFQKKLARSAMTPGQCTILKQASKNILKTKSLQ